MTYQQRLNIFLYWADFYQLKIIKAKYIPDEFDRTWANSK